MNAAIIDAIGEGDCDLWHTTCQLRTDSEQSLHSTRLCLSSSVGNVSTIRHLAGVSQLTVDSVVRRTSAMGPPSSSPAKS
jgi:hypothetical protein